MKERNNLEEGPGRGNQEEKKNDEARRFGRGNDLERTLSRIYDQTEKEVTVLFPNCELLAVAVTKHF
ncbi:unnamed protein product [Heligmosomoides polygyrus]|uniref:Uncharacterized protein n=1 Tax=Heligmosomoides polygyrus TaxID=6339 RepID=A0A183G3U4_HELPZ|nr:unnamed protein product [Heligmosomoides polygyrus]